MFEEGQVRISTSEGETVLRPRRLAWAGQDKLLVSGLSSDGHVQRSTLRFATVYDANEAVVEFKNLGISGLKPISLEEEISCQIRIIVPKEILWVIVAWFLPFLIIVAASQVVGPVPFAGPVLLIAFIVLMLSRGFWLRRLVRRMTNSTNPLFFRNIKGSLVVAEQKLILKPCYYSMVPTLIQWRSPSIFLLKCGRAEFQLTFSTSEDAAKAAGLVKASFPQMQETWTTNQ